MVVLFCSGNIYTHIGGDISVITFQPYKQDMYAYDLLSATCS